MDGNRFTDDLHLVPADQYQPVTVTELLRRQGLVDAPRDQQARALRDWLNSRPMTPLVEYSVRRNGFGELLDDAG
ncbi:hypothetical protein [Mycolicibacterium grossiae]|uniref:Uncharacterized protein n=1 Tax=Mycolicibacterium grossiae TaxID=1552759 RepID=A0A1E8QA44_9MYCO|nr:hypothetical protein [Mycolicibacterium grossiae]OFJ55306.1 hypothetical protein BEL07_02530 [Mycolicibacterium grossiae]QEM46308.1 hypothetical protein FZ046_17395 [Mycolicibacterium grossiae]